MKKLAIKAIIVYVFILLFIVFIPMKNLYFFAGQKLQNQKLFINEKTVSTFLTHTSISDADLYFEDIKALFFKKLSTKVWLVYNSVSIDDIKIDQALKDFLPLNIEYISAKYTIFYPLKVFLSSQGDFGHASGEIDLLNMVLKIELSPSDIMKTSFNKLLNMMKKIKDSKQKTRYVYELRL